MWPAEHKKVMKSLTRERNRLTLSVSLFCRLFGCRNKTKNWKAWPCKPDERNVFGQPRLLIPKYGVGSGGFEEIKENFASEVPVSRKLQRKLEDLYQCAMRSIQPQPTM
jgi:hypothetical protein